MRPPRLIAVLSLLALLLTAPVAEARKPRPFVKSVTPLAASVGEPMTIKGFYFTPGYAENVVVFVARDGRVSYVRSEHSTKTTIHITVPQKIERLLRVVDGRRVQTRFRVKVISTRPSRLATGALSQPMIGPNVGGDCDKDGTPNPEDTDDDNDLLTDALESKARTNPCVGDSDADTLSDGWEYLSALDLNRNALPYPGKKPYPNALFADQWTDYDGDGMPAYTEFEMWKREGSKYPLSYSDGDQTTNPEPVNGKFWNDFDWDNELSDDERDFDNDGLANALEYRAPDFEVWSPAFPGTDRPDYLDWDSDGDEVADGYDDQDHDDVSNIDELRRGTWAMNPCDPVYEYDPAGGFEVVGQGVVIPLVRYDEFGVPVERGRNRTCPRWMDPEQAPVKPKYACLSTTLAVSTRDPAPIETVGVNAISWLKETDKRATGTNPPPPCDVSP